MIVIVGGRGEIKGRILDYCFDNFDKKSIWLIDSLQVFDPYCLSRRDTARARLMLQSIRVSRPFTFYQLRDKIFSLRRIKPEVSIISSIDCFDDDVEDKRELQAISRSMMRCLGSLEGEVIIGSKGIIRGCEIWEGQSSLSVMRSSPSLMSSGATSRR